MAVQEGAGRAMTVTVTDLGVFEGDAIVFGGPYSNLQALDALLAVAAAAGIPAARMISTGDLVAYCADARAVVRRVRALGIAVVAGNCEKQLGAGRDDCGCGFAEGSTCSRLADAWYAHADAQLEAEDRAWLNDRPDRIVFRHRGRRYGVIHGGVREINRFVWPVAPDAELLAEIRALEAEVGPVDTVIAGHCGLSFRRDLGHRRWINAGTIGLPENDGDAAVRYLHLGDAPRILRLDYDADAAAAAMEARGLTQGYNHALRSGWWPSEDILPQALRRTGPGSGLQFDPYRDVV